MNEKNISGRINGKNKERISTGAREVEETEHFKYPGSLISEDSNTEKEISTRIIQTFQAFIILANINPMYA